MIAVLIPEHVATWLDAMHLDVCPRREEGAVRPCARCGKKALADYMVLDGVWLDARCLPTWLVHLGCLEQWLGRPLTLDDFTDAPINHAFKSGIRFGQRTATTTTATTATGS